MENKVIRTLNVYYYGVMVIALIAAVLMYYLQIKGICPTIDSLSSVGQIIQYIVIFYALITIPGGLYLCKQKCKKLSQIPDGDDKLIGYQKAALLRILLVSGSMTLGIVAFYLMGGYQSMLWIAAISAIGWYFTKPSLRKMELELQPEDPNEEKY